MDSVAGLQQTAAQWFARHASQNWTAADQVELEKWLGASVANRVEYLRLEALWRRSARLKLLGVGREADKVPSSEDLRALPFFKHLQTDDDDSPVLSDGKSAFAPKRLKYYAIAASLLILGGLGFLGEKLFTTGIDYSTPVGVTAAVPLSDGTKVTLNTGSSIQVALNARERRVELERGEAFFDVAKDPRRPFTVVAGKKRIVAVGTRFSVLREGREVRVVVTEGKVRVEFADPRESIMLGAGGVVRTHADKMAKVENSLPQAEELLSWRSGYLVFHETPLREAVREFNRYNGRRLVLGDSSIERLLVSGNFRATSVEGFTELLEKGFPIAAERQDERIVLTRR